MKRAPLFVFAGTIAGLAGMLGFHSHPPSSSLGALAGGGSSQSATHSQATSNSGSGSPSGAVHFPGGSAMRSATGATEQYGYGQLAVRVTVRSGKIVNVAVPALRTIDQYSQQLAAYVLPMLRNQVMSAQSAQINGVSGATYTSEAYAASLQAAIDKLRQA